MRKRGVMCGAVALAVTTTIGLGAAPALAFGQLPGSIIRVDAVAGGATPPQGALPYGISTHGEYVLWRTDDMTVVPGVSTYEYYVTNTVTGQVTLVTRSLSGQPLTGSQFSAELSANGRYVVYASDASGLPHPGRPGEQGEASIYRYDLKTGDIRMEDLTSTGGRPHGDAGDPAISATGRYVAFSMNTTAIGGGANRGQAADVYLRDNVTNTTTLIGPYTPRLATDDDFPLGALSTTQVSENGRYVAFLADNPGRPRNRSEVYLWDREGAGNGITLISHTPTGARVPGGAGGLSMSADGRFLTYAVRSYKHPTNQGAVFYRYRIATGQRRVFNAVYATLPGNYGFTGPVSISADGRYISYAIANYADPSARQAPHVLRYDAVTGKTQVIYRPTARPPVAEGLIYTAVYLSGDGQHAAFDTDPPPFSDPGDTNVQPDVYEWNAIAPHGQV
jgi:Tol biopolymer transport system component